MNDRNKTELTQNITRNVALWLDGKGFKPVETEVGVERGWVADVAGVCLPTQTELIDLRLINRPPRWSDAKVPQYEEWKTRFAALPSRLLALVEVKTSVGDYRGDRKWTAPWPVNLCYVAMPEGMIPANEWPAGWGVIQFSKNGEHIRKIVPPAAIATVGADQFASVVLALAIARDHVTRYARLRELSRQIRLAEGERKTVARVSNAIAFVRSVMKGKPIEEAASWHGIRTKLPGYILEDLKGIMPATGTKGANE